MSKRRLRGSSQTQIQLIFHPARVEFSDDIAAQKQSVAAARETDRRLKARCRGRMSRILDITYQAIRRRPEIFMGLLLLLTVFVGGCKGHDYTVNAVVADKFYSPSSTGTGVGMPMGKGGPNLVVTTTPEQYTLFLRFEDGQTVAQSVSRDTWVRFERGAQVLVHCNSIWGIESIDRSQQ